MVVLEEEEAVNQLQVQLVLLLSKRVLQALYSAWSVWSKDCDVTTSVIIVYAKCFLKRIAVLLWRRQ